MGLLRDQTDLSRFEGVASGPSSEPELPTFGEETTPGRASRPPDSFAPLAFPYVTGGEFPLVQTRLNVRPTETDPD